MVSQSGTLSVPRQRLRAAAWLGLRVIEARLIELGDEPADAFELDRLAAEWSLCRRRAGRDDGDEAMRAELDELLASTRRRLDTARARVAEAGASTGSAAGVEVAADGVGDPEGQRVSDEGVADGDLGDAGDPAEE